MPHTGRFEQQIFLASWFWGLQATRVGLFQDCERRCVLCLFPWFWWFTGNLWHSLACSSITPTSAFVVTWHSPWLSLHVAIFSQGHQLYWARSPLYFSMTSSQRITSATMLFPNKVTFWGLAGYDFNIHFLRGHNLTSHDFPRQV